MTESLDGASLHRSFELPQRAAEALADTLAVPPERREIHDDLDAGERP